MKVTSVEPQKKNLHRFNIFLDGQFAFGADEDLVVNHRLVSGKTLTTSDVEQLIFEAEVGKLMEKIYRLLSVRQRSEKEIRNYLKNLSFKRKLKNEEELSQNTIDTTVTFLLGKRLINDEQFANDWVESRRKKYGPNRIKQELFQKGINREIIEEVISDKRDEIRSDETAKRLLEKKVKHWKNLEPMKFKKKAYDFLLRRGFEYEKVKIVVEKLIKND